MVMHNTHQVTDELKQRIKDLAVGGIPNHLIAKIIKIDEDTLVKYYEYELTCGLGETIGDVSRIVALQAKEGDKASQSLLLKTRGAKFGWVEKQVVETVDSQHAQELNDRIKSLEEQHTKDF